MPPPKQKPITASSASGARRASSSRPARRSPTSRSVGRGGERSGGVTLARRLAVALGGQQVDRQRA